jgi:hypothetical protein
LIVAAVAVVVVIAVSIWAAVALLTPSFSPAEQSFLVDVKNPTVETPSPYYPPWVSWPDDHMLVAQGHEVCDEFAANGGSWDAIVMYHRPPDLQRYLGTQMQDLMAAATKNLCYQYSVEHDMPGG